MNLSAVVPVKNAAERLPRLLGQLATLADELVVFVDRTSTDDSEVVAREFTDDVHLFDFDPLFASIAVRAVEQCRGDWILMLDDDETLSSAWTRERVRALMSRKRITHYWIPRRWLVDDGSRYLCNSPWYPDYSLRMMRNIPSIITPPDGLHRPRTVLGEAGFLPDMPLYHWNLIVYGRAGREEKVRRYALTNPENPCGEFYLYEDYYHQPAPFVDVPARTHLPSANGPVGSSPYCIDVAIRALPQPLVAGQTYPFEVDVVNRSSRSLHPVLPYATPRKFSLSHHLSRIQNGQRESVAYGASRCPLDSTIEVGDAQRFLVDVRMPQDGGDYAITFDVVEEFVAWFADADPAGRRDIAQITILPPPS